MGLEAKVVIAKNSTESPLLTAIRTDSFGSLDGMTPIGPFSMNVAATYLNSPSIGSHHHVKTGSGVPLTGPA